MKFFLEIFSNIIAANPLRVMVIIDHEPDASPAVTATKLIERTTTTPRTSASSKSEKKPTSSARTTTSVPCARSRREKTSSGSQRTS